MGLQHSNQGVLSGAREIVRREGGGEVRVVNGAGKIVRASRIADSGNGSRGAA